LDWVDRVRAMPVSTQDYIPTLYLQGGVGSGKTRAFLAPVLEMLTQIPKIRILWGRWDFKDLKLSVMDKFFEILPAELIASKNEQYHYYDIRTPQEPSRIYFNGLKDLGGLGSQEFAVIVITEAHEITEQIYRALKRRCRQEGMPIMILMESEAPNDDHWLAQIVNPIKDNYDPDIEKWEVSTYENWHNLPAAYRGSLERMPEGWKKKYLYGHTGYIPDGKPYYSGYKEHIHAGEFEYIPGRVFHCGWDFGFHHPAVLITQIDFQDRWIWLREIIGTDITIQKFADFVKEQLNFYYPGESFIHYGDPAVTQKNDKSEKTSWEILHSKGIYLRYRQSTYRERKEIIEQKLSTLIGGKPALLLDKRYCKTANEGFLGGYHYPVRKENLPFDHKYELPYKDGFYEHIINAGEYIAVNLFSALRQGQREETKNLPRQAVTEYAVLEY